MSVPHPGLRPATGSRTSTKVVPCMAGASPPAMRPTSVQSAACISMRQMRLASFPILDGLLTATEFPVQEASRELF